MMKRFWFKRILWLLLIVGGGVFLFASSRTLVLAQQSTDVFITVTYPEQINVRAGPSTVIYDIIGNMQPGETAPALGVSPGRDWVQISFPAAPGGIGWVHTSLVAISQGTLRIVEPPPTTTPRVTNTVDPTLAAAFNFVPTQTRLPTFTPPAPIVIPQFTTEPSGTSAKPGLPVGAIMLALGVPGLIGFLFTASRRR